jgi:tetratricopeptide (TPR) repeat protein
VPSLNNGLLCLFPDYFLSDEQREKGLDWVDEHYKKLSMIYGFRLAAPEEVLFFLSHAMKRKGDLEAAIALLKVLVNRYPSSSRGYYFLGEAYREKHELQKAIEYYIKALDIDPDFVAARRRLEGLKRH